jgi:hypothetical protein
VLTDEIRSQFGLDQTGVFSSPANTEMLSDLAIRIIDDEKAETKWLA